MDAANACRTKCSCRLVEFLESSIGKKIMVALAGFLLCGFLVVHLAGNMFLFAGSKAFNHYAEVLESNPILPAAEIGLLALFLIHILLSLRAKLINSAARPEGYEACTSKGGRTPGSRTMTISGLLVLAFLAVHMKTFRFAPEELRESDIFKVVTDWFHNPYYSAFYVLALAGLGLHLSHGFQSAFQTFGFNHPRYTPAIKKLGILLALVVALGFASMPIYFGFIAKQAMACCAAAGGAQ